MRSSGATMTDVLAMPVYSVCPTGSNFTHLHNMSRCCYARISSSKNCNYTHTHTHTRLTALFRDYPGEPVPERKPIWILLKQETVSGIGISWAICKSATRSRQITMPAPHRPVFYRPDALPADQPTASKHWRGTVKTVINEKLKNETDNSAGERNGLIPRVSLL